MKTLLVCGNAFSPLTLALVLGSCLTGCAIAPDRLPLGTTREMVVETLGSPTSRHTLAHGERLQYSRQPAGQEVFNLDLDASGKLVTRAQVLREEQFAKVQPQVWLTRDLLREFGKPAMVERVANFDGQLWVYRYNHFGNNRQFFAYVDPAGVVQRTGSADEVLREPPELQ
jgi:outer membrane protein assembly factor BamE (lipoprotein component of BamABCDE complex)